MTKLVIDNSSREARQRQLEAKVQVSFARVAGSMLHALTGKRPKSDLVEDMRAFVAVYDAAEEARDDSKSTVIRMPKLDRGKSDRDEPINAVLRGALQMVAAMLDISAKNPVDNRGGQSPTNAEMKAYNKARDEIAAGVILLQKRARKPKSAHD
jgi:hypothetical protein